MPPVRRRILTAPIEKPHFFSKHESSRFYAARSALLMRREVVAGRSRRRVGLGRRRARVCCLCLELCVKFQRELASQNPPARSSVCSTSGRPRKNVKNTWGCFSVPLRLRFQRKLRQAPAVDAPPRHQRNRMTFQQVTCFFIGGGGGGEAAATRSCAAAAPCSSPAARTASSATSCSPGRRATRSSPAPPP